MERARRARATEAERERVASALREWRKRENLTRPQATPVLSRLLHADLAPRALEAWEQARSLPSAPVLLRLLDAGILR